MRDLRSFPTRLSSDLSELCLQQANKKFERRFKQVESILKQKDRALPDATLEEMEDAWQSVKQLEQDNKRLK